MKYMSTPRLTRITLAAALALMALAPWAHAATGPASTVPTVSKMKPLPGKLTDLRIALSTGGTGTDKLAATAIGVTGGACGIAITSTATLMQPVAFAVEASQPFPQTRIFEGLKKGNQTVTAAPTAGPNFPACLGAAITVSFVVP